MSSITSTYDPTKPAGSKLTENGRHFSVLTYLAFLMSLSIDWNPTTREQALANSENAMFVYSASKTLAEKAVWKIADKHPDVNVTAGRLNCVPPWRSCGLMRTLQLTEHTSSGHGPRPSLSLLGISMPSALTSGSTTLYSPKAGPRPHLAATLM
jgi:nucleoside-diphosphate-sugar epimerase